VRAIQAPVPQDGDFSHDRMTLLEGLLDKHSSRA
jgi:hypothetical protein